MPFPQFDRSQLDIRPLEERVHDLELASMMNRPDGPREPFEHVGDVPHVVFSCATLQVVDELWIYYGGADRSIGQASCPMDKVMAFLRQG